MATIPTKRSDPDAYERISQLREVLNENQVPRPHIIWLQGKALIKLLLKIGKEPYPKDGPIFHEQLYRFNLDTGRFREAVQKQWGQ